jgi:hypothetical protein
MTKPLVCFFLPLLAVSLLIGGGEEPDFIFVPAGSEEGLREVTCSGGEEGWAYFSLQYSSSPLYYNCPDGLPCVPIGDGSYTPPLCIRGDLNWDGVVNLEDFAIFQRVFTGEE